MSLTVIVVTRSQLVFVSVSFFVLLHGLLLVFLLHGVVKITIIVILIAIELLGI